MTLNPGGILTYNRNKKGSTNDDSIRHIILTGPDALAATLALGLFFSSSKNMEFRNLSKYTKNSLSSSLSQYQYCQARRWGKEASEIHGKDQRWFDGLVRKNMRRGNATAFYNLPIGEDAINALVKRGFNPEEVKQLKAFKAAEILTNLIFLDEDDWEFVDSFPAWLSKSKSQGTLYSETFAIAKQRREEARATLDPNVPSPRDAIRALGVALRRSDAEERVIRGIAALHPDLRLILEGLLANGIALDELREHDTTRVLFGDEPDANLVETAVAFLADLLERILKRRKAS
jgi:hypothetical protein